MFGSKAHRNIYYLLLALLGGFMICTKGLSSVAWVALAVNWILEGRWREKWEMIKHSRLLHAIAVFFLLHPIALLWSSNMAEGLNLFVSVLPFFAVSLVVLTTPVPPIKVRQTILFLYVGTIFVVSIIGLVRWLTIADLPHRETIPYISHIRYSLNCCMVIFAVCAMMFRRSTPMRWRLLGAGLVSWMIFTLVLLNSYTGLAVLLCVTPIVIIHVRRYKLLAAWGVVAGTFAIMVALGCWSYYHLAPIAQEPLRAETVNGRPYTHLQDGLIENGNYVNNYLCHEELSSEWMRRTGTDIASPSPSGYPIEAVLVRYMNALGLTKDSVGVAALSDSQVEEIQRGIENPVYIHGPQVRKMLYVMLFEYENYRCYNAVNGFSMLQRFELWKCAGKVFLDNPWLGTGTGDMKDAMHSQQISDDSPLRYRDLTPHNEYLTLLVMFGAVGFLLILVLALRAAHHALKCRSTLMTSTLMVAWVATVLLSCMTENTPNTLIGGMFCSWFLIFREETNINTLKTP